MRWLFQWWPALAALVAGELQALAIADPWSGQAHGWLQVVSLALLVALLRRAPAGNRPRAGFGLSWLFALAWLAGTFWWLFISMHTYGGLDPALAALGVAALAGLLGLYYALAGALFSALAPALASRRQPLITALLFAALWTLAELLRGRWFTGFPWGAGGYAHVAGAFASFAPWIGVYGIGFLAALLAALLAQALAPGLHTRRSRAWALSAVVLLGAWGALQPVLRGGAEPHPGPRLEVALLQGNIAQDIKFVPGSGVADALRWYGEQLQDNRAPLVVTPETAIPLFPSQLPPGYWQALQARYAGPGQAALIGMPLADGPGRYTNSIVGLAPGQSAPYRYDKHHLVPFGEFVPPFFRWFTNLMQIPLGDFTRGALNQPSFDWMGQRLAPNICYEDLFGEELAARFAVPARAPTAFVNASNLAWFGDTVAIDQHLSIERMRALEFDRPVISATNTGATAIINRRGVVTHELARAVRGVLHGEIEGSTRITPYAAWAARWGLAPLWLLCLGLALWGGWRLRGPACGDNRHF
jgi:apolipoprotein N-acyltransferase